MGAGHGTISSSLTEDQCIAMIAEYFHSRRMSLKDAFLLIDLDRSNFVSWSEFERAVGLCLADSGHPGFGKDVLWKIFQRFDTNRDGKLSLDEFAAQFAPAGGVSSQTWDDDYRRRGGTGSAGISSIGAGSASMGTYSTDSKRSALRDPGDIIARIAASIVRTGFTPEALFQKVDKDHSGRLSWSEIEHVILSFQPDLSLTERDAIFRKFDRDASGEIDISEFCRTLNEAQPNALVALESKISLLKEKFREMRLTLHQAFQVFDRNMDGFITRDEFQRMVQTFNLTLNVAEANAIYSRFDLNADGFVNLHEFESFFQNFIDRAPSLPPGWTYGNMPPPAPPPVTEEPWETEILELVRSCFSVGRSNMAITDVFRRLDISNTGYLTRVEFDRMVTAYRPDLNAGHLARLFSIVNVSGSGQITMGEFIRRFG